MPTCLASRVLNANHGNIPHGRPFPKCLPGQRLLLSVRIKLSMHKQHWAGASVRLHEFRLYVDRHAAGSSLSPDMHSLGPATGWGSLSQQRTLAAPCGHPTHVVARWPHSQTSALPQRFLAAPQDAQRQAPHTKRPVHAHKQPGPQLGMAACRTARQALQSSRRAAAASLIGRRGACACWGCPAGTPRAPGWRTPRPASPEGPRQRAAARARPLAPPLLPAPAASAGGWGPRPQTCGGPLPSRRSPAPPGRWT